MGLYEVLAMSFAIGVLTGCRSIAAPATVCWAARLNWLHLQDSPLSFLRSTVALAIFTVLALGELVTDKLPIAPDRRSIGSLIDRVIMGGLCGAALCISSSHSLWAGAMLGALGALAGTYGGYQVRHRIVASGKAPDFAIALIEDLIAVGGDFWIVSSFK
jgi:uncharacterized membrane protein